MQDGCAVLAFVWSEPTVQPQHFHRRSLGSSLGLDGGSLAGSLPGSSYLTGVCFRGMVTDVREVDS